MMPRRDDIQVHENGQQLATPLRCWPHDACFSKSVNIRKLTGLSENLDSAIISEAPALPLINPSHSGKATIGRIQTVQSEGIYGAARRRPPSGATGGR
jgi:hypothetical protein